MLTRAARFMDHRIRLLLAQYSFNSLHDWHFEILFIVAIISHLTHIVLEGV